ncbi:NAD(P)-dependent oxidoreductase [Amycolatopsis acidicola]|uniref:NAD(P)-dependent oxidoreductase n=1 Tax=Amycolatopsis acidicola TaxID=2596893 RepID=A0A5N0VHP5_9PSEU|nr:NAD(P)-dependent oxidoreductase [Amycolatopsis acidicola]KAA9164953.1 NAD(P)-dependent oxidoreductase [Amycolatopsis acidicola]
MKVLVTGASGRVGANMVRRLTAAGAEVRAMIPPGDPQAPKLAAFPQVQVVEADLGDQAAINVACKGVTHIVHLAAQLMRGDTPVDRFYDINAFGTLRLLEGAVQCGNRLERFVLTSSDGTYRPGAPPAVPLTEDVPQLPGDYYGTGKLIGEIVLRNHAVQYDIPFSIVRFATVVSPEEAAKIFRVDFWRTMLGWHRLGKDCHLWPLFDGHPELAPMYEAAVADAAPDTAVGLAGPGGEPWTLSLVDVRDAVDGVYRALTEPGALGRAFNIAAAEPTPHDEGAAVIADLFEVPKLMVELPIRHQLELSIDNANRHLGFRPRHDYRDMVESGLAMTGTDSEFIPANATSGVAATWQPR